MDDRPGNPGRDLDHLRANLPVAGPGIHHVIPVFHQQYARCDSHDDTREQYPVMLVHVSESAWNNKSSDDARINDRQRQEDERWIKKESGKAVTIQKKGRQTRRRDAQDASDKKGRQINTTDCKFFGYILHYMCLADFNLF